MANNYKARPSSLISISNTTHQNKVKANVSITNELNDMVQYLLSVYKNPELKDTVRMAAVKELVSMKKQLDLDILPQLTEEKAKAEQEAAKVMEAERERELKPVPTDKEVSAAKARAKKMLEELNL